MQDFHQKSTALTLNMERNQFDTQSLQSPQSTQSIHNNNNNNNIGNEWIKVLSPQEQLRQKKEFMMKHHPQRMRINSIPIVKPLHYFESSLYGMCAINNRKYMNRYNMCFRNVFSLCFIQVLGINQL